MYSLDFLQILVSLTLIQYNKLNVKTITNFFFNRILHFSNKMAVKNASPVAVKGPKLVGIKKDKTKRKSDDKSIEVPKQKAVKTDGKSKAKTGGKKDKVAKIVKVESEEPAVAKNKVR